MSRTSSDGLVQRALVLAAGKSTRIQTVVPDRPKPLIVVGGQTVLERNLRQLAASGVRDVWINVHYRGEQIESLIGNGYRYGLQVRYSWESELLGTAGAARKLATELGGDSFFVVYGDNLTALNLRGLASYHRLHRAMATMAVFDQNRVPNTGIAGGRVVVGDNWQVLHFAEGVICDSPFVNAGVYLVEPSVLEVIPPDSFCDFGRDVFPALISQGARLQAYPVDGYCLAIDTPEALVRAELLLRNLQQVEDSRRR